MFRHLFLALSTNPAAEFMTRHFPLSRRMIRRFVAGETLDDAIAAAAALSGEGMKASLDPLGENIDEAEAAAAAADRIIEIVERIAADGIDASVSIKPTQIGLDVGADACAANARRIVEAARAHGVIIQVDMEGSPYTERTLELFHALRAEYDNVGAVIQSYLYRSMEDAQRLVEVGAYVRLCKGAYKEPAEVAFPAKADVDRHFREILEILFAPEAIARGTLPAVATHDQALVDWVRQRVDDGRIARESFEFQMLFGIRRDLQAELVEQGYQVRIYVPYGPEWYPYFMRRLAERPANIVFLLRNMVTG